MSNQPKRAIIVGATSGIGYAVAQQLTAKGWEIGIAGRRQEILQEMQRKNLNIIATQQIDITNADAAERLNTLIGKMGGMDLYFHSSGVGYQNPSLDADKELRTVDTNCLGFTRMVDCAFNFFVSHPESEGHLAVISSVAGTKGLGASPAYSASKRFINHYLECLEQLLSIRKIHHLTISNIRPGFVRTPLLSDGSKYPLQLDVNKVAQEIIDKLEKKKHIIVVDWKYRVIVFFWQLIPRWLWIRMRIYTKKD